MVATINVLVLKSSVRCDTSRCLYIRLLIAARCEVLISAECLGPAIPIEVTSVDRSRGHLLEWEASLRIRVIESHSAGVVAARNRIIVSL